MFAVRYLSVYIHLKEDRPGQLIILWSLGLYQFIDFINGQISDRMDLICLCRPGIHLCSLFSQMIDLIYCKFCACKFIHISINLGDLCLSRCIGIPHDYSLICHGRIHAIWCITCVYLTIRIYLEIDICGNRIS